MDRTEELLISGSLYRICGWRCLEASWTRTLSFFLIFL